MLLASCRCSPTPCSVVTPPQRWLSGTPSALGRSVADGSSLSRQADSRPRTPIRRACPRPTSPLALVHRLGTRTGLPLEIGPAPPSQWELGSQGCSGDSSMAGWLGGGPARVGRSDRLGCWGFSPAGQGLAGIIIQNFRRRATLPFLARAAQDMHIQVARKYHPPSHGMLDLAYVRAVSNAHMPGLLCLRRRPRRLPNGTPSNLLHCTHTSPRLHKFPGLCLLLRQAPGREELGTVLLATQQPHA